MQINHHNDDQALIILWPLSYDCLLHGIIMIVIIYCNLHIINVVKEVASFQDGLGLLITDVVPLKVKTNGY